jgi:hypothetical protein
MNRFFVLTALPPFLGLHASHAQTSLHTQRVDEQIDETSCASSLVTGFHGQLNSQNRPSVTFATRFPSRLRHAVIVRD